MLGVVIAPLAAMLISRVDPRAIMSLGLAIISAMTLYRVTFSQNISLEQMIPIQLAFGSGMPLFFVPLMSVTMATVDQNEMATAAGMASFLRSMSGSFAAAIVMSAWSDGTTTSRVDLIDRIHDQSAVLARLAGGLHDQMAARRVFDGLVESQSVMLSTNHMFQYIGVIIAAVAMGVWLLPRTQGVVAVAAH